MITTGSKWFFGLGLVALVLAAAYGWTTGGDGLGPLTAGYKGGVGDHFGYTLLLSLAVLALFLGGVSVATRDADPRALAQLAGTEEPPEAVPPALLAYWPLAGGFGASLVILGLVISNVLFIAGFLVLLAVLVEWMVLAWSDKATGDPAANKVVRDRLMGPFEVPLAGVLIAGGVVAALSRVFLTTSKLGAVWTATGIATVILLIGILLAQRSKLSPNVVAGVLVLAAAGVVTAGVVSVARGERTIEPHHAEQTDHEADPAEGGEGPDTDEAPAEAPHEEEGSQPTTRNRPLVPEGTEIATTTTTEAEG
jgi:hypothetical protein